MARTKLGATADINSEKDSYSQLAALVWVGSPLSVPM